MESFAIWERFKPAERLVKEFSNWLIVVRPGQVTLGDCVLLLKRPVQSFGEMTSDEATEFTDVVSWYENAARSAFNAERFNYVAAMMKDPYAHFHAFPRYSTEQTKFGVVWKDELWPKAIEFKTVDTPEEIIHAIQAALRSS